MDAVLGLGSNLGDRVAHLAQARQRLSTLGRIVLASALYESAAVGGPPQGAFVNAAIRLESALVPQELLRQILAIEQALGRVRRERWGPRTIDVDVLWIQGQALDLEQLTVPHPRLAQRAFALRPLLDVAPEARDPRSGERYAEQLARLSGPSLTWLAGPQAWAATPEIP
jgi:2-amino-4-hydroxy-6-hydroxymethyldihydropteridine diphosphokinase